MVRHLGRLKIVTKRKEGTCNYRFCSDTMPDNNGKTLPGEKVFLLTKQGLVGTRTTIFYKQYHMTCFVAWAMWAFEQTPISKDGRIGMTDIPPEDKQARQRLVRRKAQLLRDLRTISPEKLEKTVDRIAELDREIGKTGYPVLQYRGRRSRSKINYARFLNEVKAHYEDPRRVPRSMYEEARKIGLEEQFAKDMDTWLEEKQQEAIARQGQDYEANQEDKEDE